jgi:hypothetical protein
MYENMTACERIESDIEDLKRERRALVSLINKGLVYPEFLLDFDNEYDEKIDDITHYHIYEYRNEEQ